MERFPKVVVETSMGIVRRASLRQTYRWRFLQKSDAAAGVSYYSWWSAREIVMHVLMLDDHAMFLQGLKNLLGVLSPDLRVDTSTDVAHAVQLAGLCSYELVLLDWHLAGCEGNEAMRRLRDAGCTARIVALLNFKWTAGREG